MGDLPKIRFRCSHCGQAVSVAHKHAGKYAKCPRCRRGVTVPTPPDSEDAPGPPGSLRILSTATRQGKTADRRPRGSASKTAARKGSMVADRHVDTPARERAVAPKAEHALSAPPPIPPDADADRSASKTVESFEVKSHGFLWFLVYCLVCLALYRFGSTTVGFGWFANSVFSLSFAGVLIWTAHSTTQSRLCPRRIRAALIAGADVIKLRRIFELAFGSTPPYLDSETEGVGVLAFLPLSMLAFKGLEYLLDGVFWALVLAVVVAIPAAVAVGLLAGRLAAQKAMLKKARDVAKGHDPTLWNAMATIWKDRKDEQVKAALRAQEAKRKAAETATRAKEQGKGQARTQDAVGAKSAVVSALTCPKCGRADIDTKTELEGGTTGGAIVGGALGGIMGAMVGGVVGSIVAGKRMQKNKCKSCGHAWTKKLG